MKVSEVKTLVEKQTQGMLNLIKALDIDKVNYSIISLQHECNIQLKYLEDVLKLINFNSASLSDKLKELFDQYKTVLIKDNNNNNDKIK